MPDDEKTCDMHEHQNRLVNMFMRQVMAMEELITCDHCVQTTLMFLTARLLCASIINEEPERVGKLMEWIMNETGRACAENGTDLEVNMKVPVVRRYDPRNPADMFKQISEGDTNED